VRLVGLSLVALISLVGVNAFADDTSPRLVKQCTAEPDGKLCREVRRACALQKTREEVIPACRELKWWGDTRERRLVNLCPIEPTHPDCPAMKERCEHSGARDAETDAICRALGWIQLEDPTAGVRGVGEQGGRGDRADSDDGDDGDGDGDDGDDAPLSRQQADEIVRFCKESPQASPCQQLFKLCARVGDDEPEDVRYVCAQLAADGARGAGPTGPGVPGGRPGGAGGVGGTGPGGAPGATTGTPPLGLFSASLQLGLFRDGGLRADDVAGASTVYGGWLSAARFGWGGQLVGGAAELGFGWTDRGDVGYRALALLGAGVWAGDRAVIVGLVGVGASGIEDAIPARLELPARVQCFVYATPAVTLSLWAGLGVTRALETPGGASPGVIGGADLVDGGAVVLFGGRPRGNIGAAAWSLGATYREIGGVRVFSLLLGFGQANGHP
jgi:hypothetical protein